MRKNSFAIRIKARLALQSLCGLILLCPFLGRSQTNRLLEAWSFNDTNWLSYFGYAPAAYTNLTFVPDTANGGALLIDDTNAVVLQVNAVENDGHINITLDTGSISVWFNPDWSGTNEGGVGPGEGSLLFEIGADTTNASDGWWSVFFDPD